jgi:hypothetical protein
MFFYPWYPALMLAIECHNNADQLLNQLARSLMSVAKMPCAIEQSSEEEA